MFANDNCSDLVKAAADWVEQTRAAELARAPGLWDRFGELTKKGRLMVMVELERRGASEAADKVRVLCDEMRHTITVQATGRKGDRPTEFIGWLVDHLQTRDEEDESEPFDAAAAFRERYPDATTDEVYGVRMLALVTHLALMEQAEAMDGHYARMLELEKGYAVTPKREPEG